MWSELPCEVQALILQWRARKAWKRLRAGMARVKDQMYWSRITGVDLSTGIRVTAWDEGPYAKLQVENLEEGRQLFEREKCRSNPFTPFGDGVVASCVLWVNGRIVLAGPL